LAAKAPFTGAKDKVSVKVMLSSLMVKDVGAVMVTLLVRLVPEIV